MKPLIALLLAGSMAASVAQAAEGTDAQSVQLGPRPFWLVDQMDDSALKKQLQACKGPFKRSNWSIGHRGAPLQFPEHTRESYTAAMRMGAGIVECDVTFTKDKQLVCRHAQNDLHTTTNILATPLAGKCTTGFTPAKDGQPARAECRASDVNLSEFRSLRGKMDAADRTATSVDAYMNGTARWRTDLYAGSGTLMTHRESIALLAKRGVKFMPELKAPVVPMPFHGYTQSMYAQALIDDYKAAGIPASHVWPQSFNLDDVLYWIKAEPEFGKQAVYLDGSFAGKAWSAEDPKTWPRSMKELHRKGVRYIAPPLWVLVTVRDGKLVPSTYAKEAKAAGLNIIAWTVERSGSLRNGGGWYYQSSRDITDSEGDVLELLHVLNQDVGVAGVFSDWPATTTFYANCMGLQ